jgi:alkanesulfonate monooxygenase SsuD/methylene tetrahydromethanopterin reductase-like flavin-dependent oxidoreductase (luciferase family)
MQFGLFGSAAARRGGPEFDSSEGFRDFIEYNVEAEALGFHSTFVVEHHFTGYGQVSATLNLLTWLGARTRRLRLGTAVIVLPWHNPVLLAEQAATLDLLSGGRLDFGIGKGYRYNEFAGFCVPMEEADARFDECLDVILKAWTADEPFSHQGKYWRFDNIVVEPPTAQRPHPQIWMGAGSENSIRRVAAQGFNLVLGQYASPKDVAWNIAVYQSEVEAHGRRFDPMQVGVTRAFFVAENMAEREAAMDRRLQNRMRQLKLATRPDGTVHGGPDRATGDPRTVNEVSAMYGRRHRKEARRTARRGRRIRPAQRRRLGRRQPRPRKPASLRPRNHAGLRRAMNIALIRSRSKHTVCGSMGVAPALAASP